MTVTAEEIRAIVKEIGSRADISKLKNDVPLEEQGIDSLDMVNILLNIEENYKIKVPDEDISKVGTINNIVMYINGK